MKQFRHLDYYTDLDQGTFAMPHWGEIATDMFSNLLSYL